MREVILYTKEDSLEIPGVKKTDWLDDEVRGKVIIMDIDSVGFSLLPDLREGNYLIALTGKRIPGYVMKLMSLGFHDVLLKPVEKEELEGVLKEAFSSFEDTEEVILIGEDFSQLMEEELCKELCAIVGGYKSLKEVLKLTGKAAGVDAPVLITGESGTGKELFAKAIWKLSRRNSGPFIAVNCAAIPENLLEAELFGYEKGAFSGATSSKKGLIEEAHGGILFLDEIGDLPLSLQPKLLRVLQERKVRRLGSTKEVPVNFRLISATNKDLRKMVREGTFREDLYYRISTIHIHLPPLRERKEDMQYLLNCLIKKVSRELGKPVKGYTKGFYEKVLSYPWPGNIRELENAIRKAIVFSTSDILKAGDLQLEGCEAETLKEQQKSLREFVREYLNRFPGAAYKRLIEEVESLLIEEALRRTKGSQLGASRLLGINRLTLRRKLKAYSE